ncbi:MAG: PAS domain S-box protein [Deltaproteobacteria bacterium]|nr:PAS domain S-box protein [Deltaproteobacteria bacterium]
MGTARTPRGLRARRAPRAAANGEAWYRAVFEQAAVGIARVAPEGRFLEVNDRFCEIVGYPRARLLAGDFQQITHPDDLEADLAHVERLLAGAAGSYAMEKRYVRPDGTTVWAALHVALVRDAAGAPTDFVSVVKDITAAKLSERTILESSARLETLSRRLLTVQEEERRTLARELHDEIGQQLAALKLNLEALRARHAVMAGDARLVDSLEILDHTIGQIADASLALRPSMLDDLGLEAALRSHARRQEVRSGCAVSVRGTIERRLPEHVETAAFRIAQEAVRNAIAHAAPRHVEVRVALELGMLVLTVCDDGRGFDVRAEAASPRATGMGLLGMRERAELIGGALELTSAVGAGTVVRARLPL